MAVIRYMMYALAMLVQKFAEYGRARHRLNYLVDDIGTLRKADFKCELRGRAAVGLIGGVFGREGVGLPGPDAEA